MVVTIIWKCIVVYGTFQEHIKGSLSSTSVHATSDFARLFTHYSLATAYGPKDGRPISLRKRPVAPNVKQNKNPALS